MSNPVIQVILLRYLQTQNILALFGSQFITRLMGITVAIIMIIYKVITFQHPTFNSPHHLAKPFDFSIGILMISSIMHSIGLFLMIFALKQDDMIAVKFLALYYVFELLFRATIQNFILKRQIQFNETLIFLILLCLVYILVSWIQISNQDGQDKQVLFNQTLGSNGIVLTIFSALSDVLGQLFWKYYQFKQLVETKQFNDLVSWANFINDEPEKFEENLIIQNKILSRYFEAQIRCFHERSIIQNITIDSMTEMDHRMIIAQYLKQNVVFNFQQMEKFYVQMRENLEYQNFFENEAVDDPQLYQNSNDNTPFKKIISEKVYMMQMETQKYLELFSPDKIMNFQQEGYFDDFFLDNQQIWKNTEQTFYISQYRLMFEGLFCYACSFFQKEFDDDRFWKTGLGFRAHISSDMDENKFYCILALLLGSFLVIRSVVQMRILRNTSPNSLFQFKIFTDLVSIILSIIFIEVDSLENQLFGLIGLVCAILAQSIVYQGVQEMKEHKEKLFYINFIQFLTQNQKFSIREGQQITSMMCLSAQEMPLIQFLKVFSQVIMAPGILTPEQLRQLKLTQPYIEMRDTIPSDQSLRNKLWKGGLPLIFNSQMNYENNFDKYGKECKVEVDQNLPKLNDEYKRVYGKGVESNILKSKIKKPSEINTFMSSIRPKKPNNSIVNIQQNEK